MLLLLRRLLLLLRWRLHWILRIRSLSAHHRKLRVRVLAAMLRRTRHERATIWI